MSVIKKRTLRILSVAIIVILTLACSAVNPFIGVTATPTMNYIFTPSTIELKIEPESLVNAQKGVAYEAEIKVSDNVTPVNRVVVSKGTLPAGLELVFVDHVDGAKISGVPQEAGTFTFTVGVSCFSTMVIGQVGEKEYVLVVE